VAHKREVQKAIPDIKASIALYGLTAEDLGLAGVSATPVSFGLPMVPATPGRAAVRAPVG